MKIIQSPIFAKSVKKLHKNQKSVLDDEIRNILNNPKIGEEEKGDLSGIFVHIFKILKIRFLLSYRFSEDILGLITLGPHENYYRDFKRHLKKK